MKLGKEEVAPFLPEAQHWFPLVREKLRVIPGFPGMMLDEVVERMGELLERTYRAGYEYGCSNTMMELAGKTVLNDEKESGKDKKRWINRLLTSLGICFLGKRR